MQTMQFNIAHNDQQGRSTVRAFEIILSIGADDMILHLENKELMRGENLEFTGDFIYFPNGCRVRYISKSEWAGNIMWNEYTMTPAWGLGFLYLLQQSGLWNVVEGWSELFDKWPGMVEITARDLDLPENIKKQYFVPGQYSLFHSVLTNDTGELAYYFSTGND